MKTAVVILNWNGEEFLREFLPGVVASVKKCGKLAEREVVVADNGSTDKSMDWVREQFPDVRRIMLEKNYGFTGGYNRALEMIDADYYVLLNTDVEVAEGWLEPLEGWMDAHPKCGVCAPKLKSYANRKMFEYAGAAGGYIDKYGYPFCKGRVMQLVEEDEGQYDEPANVLWTSGACMMVRSDIYRRLGGFDERFFAHHEEIDFCWRVQLEGYEVTVVPQSVVYHVGGGTLPSDSAWKLMLNYRNNLLMQNNNLAKTFALFHFLHHDPSASWNRGYMNALKDGIYIDFPPDPDYDRQPYIVAAAEHGIRKAARTIFTKKVLDGCSAMVYLLSGKSDYVKAVRDAHKEYRAMSKEITVQEIEDYLQRNDTPYDFIGIYHHWMIPRVLLKGKKFFKTIRKFSQRHIYKEIKDITE